MTKRSKTTSPIAKFISRRIYDLQSRKSQAEIAAEAGFNSPNMLSMIKTGATTLPIERAAKLAKALECDPMMLIRMVLDETLSGELVARIFKSEGVALTKNEQSIVVRLRELTDNSDPELTAELDRSLVPIFVPEVVGARRAVVEHYRVLIGREVKAMRDELATCEKNAGQALVRSRETSKHLEAMQLDLDRLVRSFG